MQQNLAQEHHGSFRFLDTATAASGKVEWEMRHLPSIFAPMMLQLIRI